MIFYTLDPSYYIPAKTVAINEAIAAIMPEFVAKITDNKKERKSDG